MSRKKQNNAGSLVAGLVGLGIGALAAFAMTKIFGDDSEKVPVNHNKPSQKQQQRSQQVSYVNRNESFEQTMSCPISYQVMNEPMSIPQCGHSFEKKHIVSHLKKDNKCPICRRQTTLQSLVPNFQLKAVIEKYHQTRR